MNKEQQQILKEVWSNYRAAFVEGHVHQELDKCLSIEEFIEEIKTDNEFSEKWGLHIEERELTLEERYNLMPHIVGHSQENIDMRKKINNFEGNIPGISYHEEWLNSFKIPTRLITLTYNNQTIKNYE